MLFKRFFVFAIVFIFSFLSFSCKQTTTSGKNDSDDSNSTTDIYGVPYADPIERDFTGTTWKAVKVNVSTNIEWEDIEWDDVFMCSPGLCYLKFLEGNILEFYSDSEFTKKTSSIKYEYVPENNNCFTVIELRNRDSEIVTDESNYDFLGFSDIFNLFYSLDGEKGTITLLYHTVNFANHVSTSREDNPYIAGYEDRIFEEIK